MQLFLDSDLSKFYQETSAFFAKERLLHSKIRGLIGRYLEVQKPMSILARLVDDKGVVVASGIQTERERALLLSQLSIAKAEEFARFLADRIDSLPGVNGPNPTVEVFAKQWAALKNKQLELINDLRLFELKQLTPARATTGFARPAEKRDRDIIFDYLSRFRDEAIPHDPKPLRDDLYAMIDAAIERGVYFLWEDQGAVVSLVGSSRETPDEKWIAPVYTPRSHRGRGYGSALTAHVSQKILDSGKIGVLFTNQDNPISNGIYQKIGYRPVADFKHMNFIPAEQR